MPTNLIPTGYAIHRVTWAEAQTALMRIRQKVFIEEQGVSQAEECDGLDESATHFLAMDTQKQEIGCARVLTEGASNMPEIQQLHIGRVAVYQAYRQQGIGKLLMEAVLNWCTHQVPGAPIYLNAQVERLKFYHHLGFIGVGPTFLDAGILHQRMWYKNIPED